MATVDVTVRGAGILGLSVAWACARRGARVRIVDPQGIGAGASGGLVGALSPHVPEQWNPKKAFQLESLLMAEDWWADVAATGSTSPGYARTGRLQPIADDAALTLAHQRTETAATLWPAGVLWQVIPATTFPGWSPPTPTGFLIHDKLTARIAPRMALAALKSALITKGATFATDAPDEGQTLWATGTADLTEPEHLIGTGEKGQAALLDLAAPDQPQLFIDGLHIVPHADGTTAIGSTSERSWTDPTTTDAHLDALITRARAAFPPLAGASVLARWAALRPRTKTRAPLLGPHPFRKSAFIANGGFKIGFGIAPLVGEVMADLILGNHNRIPPEMLARP
ncbi:MAG: FAD-binding oxidoreductase [Rhodobacterales bacterium]|nr:FAD-binding oxidoreductase [Rhodobacterales bacterium]